MAYSQAAAQELAVRGLGFVADRPELVTELIANSGLRPDDLRAASERPEFSMYILDFLMENDLRVIEFAREAGINPEDIMAARTVLAGPGSFGWEPD